MALQISELFVYPVKGLKGISTKEADALEKGFRYDRRWMLTDESGLFISQREVPGLALFQTAMVGEFLAVSYRESSIMIPLDHRQYTGAPEQVRVWNDTPEATEVGANFSQWFSDTLKTKVKLYFMEEEENRQVEKDHGVQSTVSFADAYPYLVVSQASLDDLNVRLSQPVAMNRFRPNIVVAGAVPYEEDSWDKFVAGNAVFRGIKTCSRCNVPGINQETGISEKEPLKTLAQYRKVGGKVKFGMNSVLVKPGTVRVGDVISLF